MSKRQVSNFKLTKASKYAKLVLLYCCFQNILQTYLSSASYSPRPQWQRLNSHHRRLDVTPESDYADDNTEDIYNIVPIRGDLVYAATVSASVLICLASTRKRLSDGCTFEKIGFGRVSGWQAGSCSEHVDGFEDKEARESTTEV
jgi:hypothetical protein